MAYTRTLISWEDFLKKEYSEPAWLVNPYVARNGITFLWGETSTGKSPLGWHLASAVGNGTNFMGLPAFPGRVLYLELDTPERLVHERVSKLSPVQNVDFLFLPPLSVPDVSGADLAMLQRAAGNAYDLVIVNTLRKTHNLDDKDSATPKLVYSFYQHMFPGSALVFVHHTKKPQADHDTRLKDNFSGAMNWLNDAQVGLALQAYESSVEGINVRLHHEKSQVSPLYKALGLRLEADGAHLTCPKFDRLLLTYELVAEADLKGPALVAELVKRLNCSPASAYLLKEAVETGAFPGVSWLGLKEKG